MVQIPGNHAVSDGNKSHGAQPRDPCGRVMDPELVPSHRLIKTSIWPCCQLRLPNLHGPGDSMILWHQDSFRCQPGPWVSALPSVVTGVSDINIDPGCDGAMNSDIALCSSSILDGAMTTGGSQGH